MQRKWAMASGSSAGGFRLFGRRAIALIALGIGLSAAAASAQGGLSATELKAEATELRAALAGVDEEAFAQILTLVEIIEDPVPDTITVYDIIVHYDPDRYSNPSVGSYPMSFENQFIHWGRRIALHTKRTSWTSRRFYLRDISVAHEAWILTLDARLLMGPMRKNLPVDDARWLRFIHALSPYIDLRTMSYWLRLMHSEERELTIRRRLRELEAEKNSLLKDLKP